MTAPTMTDDADVRDPGTPTPHPERPALLSPAALVAFVVPTGAGSLVSWWLLALLHLDAGGGIVNGEVVSFTVEPALRWVFAAGVPAVLAWLIGLSAAAVVLAGEVRGEHVPARRAWVWALRHPWALVRVFAAVMGASIVAVPVMVVAAGFVSLTTQPTSPLLNWESSPGVAPLLGAVAGVCVVAPVLGRVLRRGVAGVILSGDRAARREYRSIARRPLPLEALWAARAVMAGCVGAGILVVADMVLPVAWTGSTVFVAVRAVAVSLGTVAVLSALVGDVLLARWSQLPASPYPAPAPGQAQVRPTGRSRALVVSVAVVVAAAPTLVAAVAAAWNPWQVVRLDRAETVSVPGIPRVTMVDGLAVRTAWAKIGDLEAQVCAPTSCSRDWEEWAYFQEAFAADGSTLWSARWEVSGEETFGEVENAPITLRLFRPDTADLPPDGGAPHEELTALTGAEPIVEVQESDFVTLSEEPWSLNASPRAPVALVATENGAVVATAVGSDHLGTAVVTVSTCIDERCTAESVENSWHLGGSASRWISWWVATERLTPRRSARGASGGPTRGSPCSSATASATSSRGPWSRPPGRTARGVGPPTVRARMSRSPRTARSGYCTGRWVGWTPACSGVRTSPAPPGTRRPCPGSATVSRLSRSMTPVVR